MASAAVGFRQVCLVFGAGLASTASAFTFVNIVLAFWGSGVEESGICVTEPNGIPPRLRLTFTVVEGGSGCLRF